MSNPPSEPSILIRPAVPGDEQQWQRFVRAQPAAAVFHDWRWLPIISATFDHRDRSLLAFRGDEIVGLLPLMEVSTRLFGHTLVSLPFCQWAGVLALDAQADRALRKAAIDMAIELGVSHVEWRETAPGPSERPTQGDLYVLFRKSIAQDDEINLKAIPRKQRAMIRKGISNGLTAGPCSVQTFYSLYTDNVHRHGTPCAPLRFFEAIQHAFGDDCECLLVESPQGEPVSSVLTLYWRDEVFPFYAGDTEKARQLAANDFKYWEVMRRGVQRGCSVFNYGRSKRGTGSFDFKRNWGFEPQSLHYQFWLAPGESVPALNPNNPKYRLVIEGWRRMPRWLVNRLGPLLIRGLG